MPDADPQAQAQALRAFNCFCTGRIGGLGAGLRASRFSPTESRVLWEVAQRPAATGCWPARPTTASAMRSTAR